MYRLMQPSDWAEVLALWQAQRGDTEEFVRGAVERFAGVQNVYVAEENDHIEAVALAVYACNTPVISAVGHETDTTLADYAADMRAPTPSAAAEIATPDKADILNAVRLLRQKLDKAMELKLDKAVSQIESCDKLLKLYSPEKRLEQSEKAVCDIEKRLSQIMERRLEKLSVKLDGYVSSLNMLSPFNILGRGYAIVQKDESVVDSVSMLNVGDDVNIKLSDGSVSAKITFVK